MKIITQSLYTSDNKVATAGRPMDYTKDVNKIPYEKYGDMLTSGELVVKRFNYAKAYTIVKDDTGNCWKVTYQQEDFTAVLTKVK